VNRSYSVESVTTGKNTFVSFKPGVMSINKHLFSALLFASISIAGNGQSVRAYMAKGATAFQSNNFSSALAYYQVVIEESGERLDALYFAAESARQMRAYSVAEEYFEAIPPEDRREEFALTNYYLALTKKSLEKFDEAIALFTTFAKERHDLSKYRERALQEIENCQWAKEMMQKPAKVELTQLGESINSVFSDYAPVAIGDTLYYTTTDRMNIDQSKKKKKKKHYKIRRKKSKNTEEVLVTKIFQSVKGLTSDPIRQNSRSERTFTANLAFNAKHSKMYYTVCEQLDVEQNIFRCELFYRERQARDDWGRPIRLPDHVNVPGSNATQPAIGLDAKTGQETLYFVSDRPGGKGRLDIWTSNIDKNGGFSQPVNLADLNTMDDDLSPFYDNASQSLYFASAGYLNFGGYDIFKSQRGEKGWTEPENVGYPINSSYDDAFFTIDHTTGKAYFASNRKGNYCISPDKDCNLHDIYEVTNKAELLVSAFNELDFSMIYGASIELENLSNGAKEVFRMEPGEYKFNLPVNPQRRYRMQVSKEGYEPVIVDIEPKDLAGDEPKKYVFIKPWTHLVIRTLDARSSLPLTGLSLRITDLKDKTSEIVQLAPDQSEYAMPLKTDRNYEVAAIKSGFDAAAEVISANDLRSQSLEKNLYLKNFYSGLPLSVYFDNDEPSDKSSTPPSACEIDYSQTYEKYMQKKGDFIKENAKGLKGVDAEFARMEAMRFFDTEIQSGYYNLLRLSENLLFSLENGEKIELQVEGYASPLADDHHNQQLSERRIQTVINHFSTFRNGAFKKYLGKQLTIVKVPFGEKTDTSVSDSAKDRRASVYSPKASKERRVVIGGFVVPANGKSSSLK
jgi:tetratricopeptide (TPR) repeat protein